MTSTIRTFTTVLLIAGCNCEPVVEDVPSAGDAERFAEVMCDGLQRCGCIEETFGSLAACVHDRVSVFKEVERWEGMRFDADCFERAVTWIETAGCEVDLDGLEVNCLIFEGTLGAGAACAPVAHESPYLGALGFNVCRGDLQCNRGRCESPNANDVGVGESCTLGEGVRCDGAYCSRDGVCTPRAQSGGACSTPNGCDNSPDYCAGLVDGGEGTCQPKHQVGEACDPREFGSCAGRLDDAGSYHWAYCASDGTCADFWPPLCTGAALRPDEYDARDWVPL